MAKSCVKHKNKCENAQRKADFVRDLRFAYLVEVNCRKSDCESNFIDIYYTTKRSLCVYFYRS